MRRRTRNILGPVWTLLPALLALVALPVVARAQQAPPQGSAEIHEFYLHPSTTQAGGHPDVHLLFRFCDKAPHILNATNANPIVITTDVPHGLQTNDEITVRGVGGNLAANTPGGEAVVLSPTTFELHAFDSQPGPGPPIAGSGSYAGGGWVSKFGSPALHGCTLAQQEEQLRRFLLQLPPGFLGNPEVADVCPADRWLTSNNRFFPGLGCPATTQVGQSTTRTVTIPPAGQMISVPTGLYRVPTLGLEPARLGTDVLIGDPPGVVPIAITLRTSEQRPPADYGINSAVIDLPKNLGGPQANIAEIETVLCGYAPCTVTPNPPDNVNFQVPTAVHSVPGARPFFVNPTSCRPAVATLQGFSWLAPQQPASATSTDVVGGNEVPSFTPTGCENVPFDATLFFDPAAAETDVAGQPSAQRVVIDYCALGSTLGRCVNGHDFADDPIWESALRTADVTLPEGMTLSPGGGNGLEGCDFSQFGVSAAGKQLNDDPPTCPDGSEIGTIKVVSPVLPEKTPAGTNTLSGKVFFGCDRTSADQPCLTTPGRPTPQDPWKLFLYIEGAGLRIKLVGNVDVSPEGQIHNVFEDQPQVPFERLELNLRGGDRAILANPDSNCGTHKGSATLVGWAEPDDKSFLKRTTSEPQVTTTGCSDPKPFGPQIVSAGSDPEQAGANTTSHIQISRSDGEADIKSLKLSLPPGAVGSLAAVPMCDLASAQAGHCSVASKIGTVKTTVGTGSSLLTATGSLFLAEPSQPTDAATLALVVPAKAGPIDLGQVVVMNRVTLRDSDTGVDAITSEIPNMLGGVPLHVRNIEITVDRPGFFLNPTGCDQRTLTATFTSYDGRDSTSSMNLAAKGCDKLDFSPNLRMIAGAKGQNGQLQHPPLTTIVTQAPGEANIKGSVVILPDLIRPNATQFNVPGGLCSDTEFAQNACPAPSLVGSARVITPVLPFQLSGPVYVVQEVGSVLPKLYIVLAGRGIRVVLRSRNSFLHAIYTVNTLENLPDVPQAYFELKIKGGPSGILNNFYNACGVAKVHRKIDYTFTGQNGKQVKKVSYLEQEGCATASSLGASISSRTIKVNRAGIGTLKVRCRSTKSCKGKLSVSAKKVKAGMRFTISAKKAKTLKLKFSKGEVRKIFKTKRLKGRATAKVGGKSSKRSIVLVPKR